MLNTSECSVSKSSSNGRSNKTDNLKTVFILILTVAVIMETGALVWMTTTRQTRVSLRLARRMRGRLTGQSIHRLLLDLFSFCCNWHLRKLS